MRNLWLNIGSTAKNVQTAKAGAEAPAYFQAASPDFAKALAGRPRRRWFYSPVIRPASRIPVVSVLIFQGVFCAIDLQCSEG